MHIRRISLATLMAFLAIATTPFAPNFGVLSLFTRVLAQEAASSQKAEADRLLEQGNKQWYANQFEAALLSYQQALNVYRKIKNRSGELEALSSLGETCHSLSKYDEAIKYHEQSLRLAREIGNLQNESRSLFNLGLAYYWLENYTKAIEYYNQGLPIARKISNSQRELNFLLHLGLASFWRKDYAKAIEYYNQGLPIARKISNSQTESSFLFQLGAAYYWLNDYAKAIEHYEQSLAISQKIRDRKSEAMVLHQLGEVYHYLGNYAKAIDYQQQSLAILKEVSDRLLESTTLNNLGKNYYSLNNEAQAIESYEQALRLSQQFGNRNGEGTALSGLGSIYKNRGDYSLAIDYFQQSLTLHRRIHNRYNEGATLYNIGQVYLAQGNYAKAIDYYQQGLTVSREIKEIYGEANCLSSIGFALFKQGNFTEAEKNIRVGIERFESIRQKLGSRDDLKVSIFETQANSYHILQQVLIAQNKTEEALEIAERGRARAFAELLAQRQGTSSSAQQAIAPPNIKQIRQIAQQQKATLVEYSIVRDALYIWVVKPTGEVAFRRVSLDANLPNLAESSRVAAAVSASSRGVANEVITSFVRGTREAVGTTSAPASSEQATSLGTSSRRCFGNRCLKQMHSLLVEPIANLLPTNPEARVIFIPYQSLFLVPFAALQDKDGKFLIEKHTILVAPSIQVLDLTRQQRQSTRQASTQNAVVVGIPRSAVVVGNPTMPSVSSEPGEPSKPLDPLPGAEAEAKAIAELLKTESLTGNQATKAAVLQQMAGARIIHLATHGLLDDLGKMGIPGAIALAPSGSDNGLLTSNEVLDLKLNAELVVLSACHTGRGRITGDGVIGLSRSFITAGAPSIIVSLWKVSDESTAFLMPEFYRQLQQNPDKAQALRLAMLKTMKQEKYSNPTHWAAFTLIGKAE